MPTVRVIEGWRISSTLSFSRIGSCGTCTGCAPGVPQRVRSMVRARDGEGLLCNTSGACPQNLSTCGSSGSSRQRTSHAEAGSSSAATRRQRRLMRIRRYNATSSSGRWRRLACHLDSCSRPPRSRTRAFSASPRTTARSSAARSRVCCCFARIRLFRPPPRQHRHQVIVRGRRRAKHTGGGGS
jgi:hypothetical protein